jgi:CDP-glucose 4,6-dehydratase
MLIDPTFWKNKRVFITGHTGFKGSWLSFWLQSLGAILKGYALPPPASPNLFTVLNLPSVIGETFFDIRDKEALKKEIASFQPEIVFHLAAQPLVRYSYVHPVETFETNINGTINLFEAIRQVNSVRAVVIVTSDKCYQNREWVRGYREDDPLGGFDPYSSSKACVELITAAYRNSFFHENDYGKTHHVAIASVRAGNVIGGGDWSPDRLIPDCIRSLAKKETILIRFPNSVRPWQHVFEPVYAYLVLAENLSVAGMKFAQAWNIGPGIDGTMTVETLVKKFINLFGEGKYTYDESVHPHEAASLRLDCGKLQAWLNIITVYKIEYALEKTVSWYKCYQKDPAAIIPFSQNQIKEYQNRADR